MSGVWIVWGACQQVLKSLFLSTNIKARCPTLIRMLQTALLNRYTGTCSTTRTLAAGSLCSSFTLTVWGLLLWYTVRILGCIWYLTRHNIYADQGLRHWDPSRALNPLGIYAISYCLMRWPILLLNKVGGKVHLWGVGRVSCLWLTLSHFNISPPVLVCKFLIHSVHLCTQPPAHPWSFSSSQTPSVHTLTHLLAYSLQNIPQTFPTLPLLVLTASMHLWLLLWKLEWLGGFESNANKIVLKLPWWT